MEIMDKDVRVVQVECPPIEGVILSPSMFVLKQETMGVNNRIMVERDMLDELIIQLLKLRVKIDEDSDK
jgi:hypothetical protein